MSRPVLIAHAAGDEEHAEALAVSIAAAGYLVVHAGTVLVGESLIEEASRALTAGAPVVLCGTIRAMGTPWAHRMVNAARGVNPEVRVYGVAIEQDAYLQPLALDGKIAEYWRDPTAALDSVVTALLRHYPLAPTMTPRAGDGPAAARRFRDLLLSSCDIIDLANLPADRRLATRELALRNLFLPLTVRTETGADTGPAVAPAVSAARSASTSKSKAGGPVRTVRERTAAQPPGTRLESAHRLVVLGDPGSGKSTLLRWMATAYLLRLRGDAAWRELPGVRTLPDEDWLPILVRCRDLGPAQVDGAFDDVLLHVLRRAELSSSEIEAMRIELEERLSSGTALLLVDGLDEISDPRSRNRFCELLERVRLSRPRLPIVVTSRIVGYREMGRRIGRGFEHVTLAELDGQAKDDFIRRWCAVTESPERRKPVADELIADVHGTDRIERLTGNPMLLTTLALVKRSVGKLPDHRADLYGEAVRVLLSWRAEVDEPINPREAEPQLQYLAYAMSDRGVQQLTEDEALELLDQMRAEYPQLRSIHRREPAEFLRLLERRTGIMIEKGHVRRAGRMVSLFEFRHLTFQEYLTAQAMVQGNFPHRDRDEDLAARVGGLAGRAGGGDDFEDTWQEVIRLSVSLCHGDDVDRVLSAVLSEQPLLAARCLADEPDAGATVAGEILQALVRAVPADARWNSPGAVAIVDLARTTWAPALRGQLLAELRSRGPAAVPSLGQLIGQALRPDADQGLPARQSALMAGLEAGGDRSLVAALVFGAQTDENDALAVLPVADLLALLEQPDPIAAAAAAWLMYVTQPPSGGGWWPSDADIDHMVALASTGRPARMTLLSLIGAVGPRRWPDVMELLVGIAGEPVTEVRSEALWLLGYVDQEGVLPTVLEALTDGEADARENAAAGLTGLRSSTAGPALITALADEVSDVRRAAVRALGELTESTATSKLLVALNDPADDVQFEVVRALGTIGDSTAFAPLLERLRSSEGGWSWHLIEALTKIGDDRLVPVLVDAFDELPETSIPWALVAFGSLTDRRALGIVRQYLTREAPVPGVEWAVNALGRLTDGEPADRVVIESALAADKPEVRGQAAWALRYIGDDAARERLAGLVTDESDDVRGEVADALAEFDGEPVLAAARLLGSDESPAVRATAMKAVSAAWTSAGFDMLAIGLGDPDPRVRRAAAENLRQYDEDRARDLLISASYDPVAQVREGVASALRQPCGRSVADTLVRLAEDREPSVRSAAVESLGSTGGPGVLSRLVRALHDPDSIQRLRAAAGLGQLLDDRAVEPLATALGDPQPSVRREAASALGNLSSERVVELLVGRLSDPAPMVRRAVADALAAGAVPAGQSALRTLLDDPHPAVRAAAAAAMGELALPERVANLLPRLADPHPLVRRSAIWSLDDDGAVEQLIYCLDDPTTVVREAALWMLGMIGAPTVRPHLHSIVARSYGSRRATALEALSRTEGPDVLPLLTAALDDPHPAVRRVAVRESRRARSAVPAARLRAALADPDSGVRGEAARTVAAVGDLDAVPMLIDRLRHDPVPWVQVRFAGALVRLDARVAKAPLTAMLVHPDYYLRETAAWALAVFGDLEPLAELRGRYGTMTALARRSLTGPLAKVGDPYAHRLMRIGLASPSRVVRRRWMGIAGNELIDQFDRDLLSRYGDGASEEIDPHEVIDARRIDRMARTLWRTPDEIRRAYVKLSGEIPLRIAG